MGAFGMADTLMGVATTEADVVAAVLQPAILISFEFKLSQGNPTNVDAAGQKWREAAGKIEQAKNELQQAVAGIPPEAWTADDHTAYQQKVQQACEQLEIIHTYCMVIGVALTAFAVALLIYAIFAFGMGTALVVILAIVLAEAATIVGAPAAIAEGESAAATCLTITSVATAILAGAAELAAAVFQGSAVGGAADESSHGDAQAFNDLKTGEKEGAVTAGVNLAQNAINAGLNYANRTPGGKGTPLKSVDLDADADKDGTWNVGGNAKVGLGKDDGHEVTAGGHVQVDKNGHVVGGQGEVNYKNPSGWSVGANGGRNADGTWSGHVTGGYEPTVPTGNKHTYYDGQGNQHEFTPPGFKPGGNVDLGGSYDPKTGQWSGSATGNQTVQGGTVDSHSVTVDNNGHGHGSVTAADDNWEGKQEYKAKY